MTLFFEQDFKIAFKSGYILCYKNGDYSFRSGLLKETPWQQAVRKQLKKEKELEQKIIVNQKVWFSFMVYQPL